MSENDNTKDLTESLPVKLTDGEKLDWLVRLVSEMNERLGQVEKLVTRGTNPLPENYNVRFSGVESNLRYVNAHLRGLREDLERERRQPFTMEDQIEQLERRAA